MIGQQLAMFMDPRELVASAWPCDGDPRLRGERWTKIDKDHYGFVSTPAMQVPVADAWASIWDRKADDVLSHFTCLGECEYHDAEDCGDDECSDHECNCGEFHEQGAGLEGVWHGRETARVPVLLGFTDALSSWDLTPPNTDGIPWIVGNGHHRIIASHHGNVLLPVIWFDNAEEAHNSWEDDMDGGGSWVTRRKILMGLHPEWCECEGCISNEDDEYMEDEG